MKVIFQIPSVIGSIGSKVLKDIEAAELGETILDISKLVIKSYLVEVVSHSMDDASVRKLTSDASERLVLTDWCELFDDTIQNTVEDFLSSMEYDDVVKLLDNLDWTAVISEDVDGVDEISSTAKTSKFGAALYSTLTETNASIEYYTDALSYAFRAVLYCMSIPAISDDQVAEARAILNSFGIYSISDEDDVIDLPSRAMLVEVE